MTNSCRALALALTAALLSLAPAARADDAPKPAIEAEKMAEMMASAKKLTSPGEHHVLLAKLLGTWDTELRITMPGAKPEKGVATFSWLIDGRWLQMTSEGTMMGLPNRTFMILGYDNFKQSYVTASVSGMDTAMLTSEGDVDPRTGALVTYGTLDEYLTGEHDKMVKYVWRFPNANSMTLEVHDLPIGETNTKVLEFGFTRRAQAAVR